MIFEKTSYKQKKKRKTILPLSIPLSHTLKVKCECFCTLRDRLTEDDCIGTTFLALQSISGQGDEGILTGP